MKLGDAPATQATSRRPTSEKKRPDHHKLSVTSDRRLVVLGSMSGAGIVMTGAALAVAMNALSVSPVAATSLTIVLVGGAATGLACGGCFSMRMVPRAKHQGLLGAADPAWSGDPLLAWDTAPGEDIHIFRL